MRDTKDTNVTAFDLIKERLEEKSFLMPPREKGHYADNGVFLDDALSIVSEVEAEYSNTQTQGDKIRAMSDEELAEYLYDVSILRNPCEIVQNRYLFDLSITESKKAILQWLKSDITDQKERPREGVSQRLF